MPSYKLTEVLKPAGAEWAHADAMNAAGTLAGYTEFPWIGVDTPDDKGTVWSGAIPSVIEGQSVDVFLRGINDAGDVVGGRSGLGGGMPYLAVARLAGSDVLLDLSTLVDGEECSANAINNDRIVPLNIDTSGAQRFVLVNLDALAQGVQDPGLPPWAAEIQAAGINEDGVVVGYSVEGGSIDDRRGLVYDPSSAAKWLDLGPGVEPLAITGPWVVGRCHPDPSSWLEVPFRYHLGTDPATIWTDGLFAGDDEQGAAYDVDATGSVVGRRDDSAFLFDGTLHDLDDLVVVAPPNITLYSAHAINADGKILCTAAKVLNPDSENPTTYYPPVVLTRTTRKVPPLHKVHIDEKLAWWMLFGGAIHGAGGWGAPYGGGPGSPIDPHGPLGWMSLRQSQRDEYVAQVVEKLSSLIGNKTSRDALERAARSAIAAARTRRAPRAARLKGRTPRK